MENGLATYYKTETRRNAYNTTDRLHTGKEFHAFGGSKGSVVIQEMH